jgi:putative ABC transport system permease protein
METLFKDIHFGLRMLARSRGVTFVAILTLALGIGVNSAIFSLVHAVLLKPLPVRDADRVVTIAMNSTRLNAVGAQPSFSVYAAQREKDVFESVSAAAGGTAVIDIEGQERPAKRWRVTAGFLTTLGINPVLGRNFTPEEDQPGASKVAILSNSLWRGPFNADPRVLGATLKIDGESFTITGVLPQGFHVDGRPADVYTPLAMSLNSRDYLAVNIYARLKDGITPEQAQAAIQPTKHTNSPAQWKPAVWTLRDFQVRDVRISLLVLLGAVGLVLLIACANIASLLLARAQARQHEIAIRAALGAGQLRLLRQMLTESTLLSIIGGLAGVGVAAICIRILPTLMHERLPGLIEQTRIDPAVLLFTLFISVLTGLAFGAVPALSLSREDPHSTLKSGARAGRGEHAHRAFRALVVTETALALMLAIGATLLIKTFFYLRDVAPGFKVDGLLIATINSERNKFASPQRYLEYYEEIIRNVRAIPGVPSATFAQALPLTGDNYAMQWPIEGHQFANPQDAPVLWNRTVDTEYFRTMQIPLRRGRLFNPADTITAPKAVIVNEAFVRRFWPDQDPIGKHVGGGPVPVFEVIGVVGDVRHQDTTKEAPNEVFFHYQQGPTARVTLAVRADTNVFPSPLVVEPALRRAIAAVDAAQPITKIAEIQQVISDRIAPKRLSAQLIAVFAGLATLLALIGIYGVLSFSVARGTHELGLRMALGANPAALLRMVIQQAALLAGIGIAIGLAASIALARVLSSLVFGSSTTDPSTYALAAAGTLALAVLASAVPAWRAARVDPLIALREE